MDDFGIWKVKCPSCGHINIAILSDENSTATDPLDMGDVARVEAVTNASTPIADIEKSKKPSGESKCEKCGLPLRYWCKNDG